MFGANLQDYRLSYRRVFTFDNPLVSEMKKAANGSPVLLVWWRRGESNPRPQALRPRPYMLSFTFNLTASSR